MMNVVRWPDKMPEGGLISRGKSTYDRNKTKVCDPLGSCEQTIQISLLLPQRIASKNKVEVAG